MSVLIFSYLKDPHALAVRWGLRERDVKCDIFCSESILTGSTISIDPVSSTHVLRGNPPSLYIKAKFEATLAEYNTVWHRRFQVPDIPNELHPDDSLNARSAARNYLDSLRIAAPKKQLWLNDRSSQLWVNSKLNQLQLADKIGWKTPKTIFTNDPSTAREFVETTGMAIMKPLVPMIWADEDPDASVLAMTTVINKGDLINDIAIQACPMIYQELVDKVEEYRVLVLGADITVVKLNTQKFSDTSVDWRAVNPNTLDVEVVNLGSEFEDRIHTFMKEGGLMTGSFDFAQDSNGDLVFFEINEQGQILWIEEANPDIKILDRLVSFFSNPSATWQYNKNTELSFDQYKKTDEWSALVKEVEVSDDASYPSKP